MRALSRFSLPRRDQVRAEFILALLFAVFVAYLIKAVLS